MIPEGVLTLFIQHFYFFLKQLVESDPHQTARELAAKLSVSHVTILEHLHAIGKVSKLDQWVPHELSERNRQRRAEAAATLLSYQSTTAWLDTIVTGNEKWCCYVNVKRRRSWIDVGSQPQRQPKSGLHSLKVMLSVWWDSEGVILYELLPKNKTITADVYCAQLDRLAAQIERQRPGHGHIRFLHDNARPHVAKSTRQKLLDLDW